MKGRDLRTQFSVQASDLAATFNSALMKMRLQPGDYVPELTAPEGPSTGGGVQSLQRLRLVPQQPGWPTLVCGSANQKEGTAELRTWEHLDAIYRHRFKRPLPLDRAQYDNFLQMAKNFLDVLRLRTTLAGPPAFIADESSSMTPELDAAPSSSSSAGLVIGIVVFVFVLLVLGGVGAWIFLVKR